MMTSESRRERVDDTVRRVFSFRRPNAETLSPRRRHHDDVVFFCAAPRARSDWRRARVRRMDLQAFIVRGQVFSLMRKALRAASQAPPESRAEIRAEIRRSFEASRHHDDSRTIKHLLSDGRILVKQLKEMVGLTT